MELKRRFEGSNVLYHACTLLVVTMLLNFSIKSCIFHLTICNDALAKARQRDAQVRTTTRLVMTQNRLSWMRDRFISMCILHAPFLVDP